MNTTRRLALLLPALASPALGQGAWRPARTVRMVVGFPPGGFTDVLARVLAPALTEALGQSVVIENRAGAAGTLGADIVAKSAPDGHTILMGHVTANALAASLFPNLPYDMNRAFAPVTLVAQQPHLVLAGQGVAARDLAGLIAEARARPGALSYASSGLGSVQHLAGEMFKAGAGVDLLHVPYRGTGPALADIAGGAVNLGFDGMGPSLPLVRGGRMRALAVTMPERVPALPDLPTVAEIGGGLADYRIASWFGLFLPAGAAPEVVLRFQSETVRALANPDIRRVLDEAGALPGGMPPEEFTVWVASEAQRLGAVARRLNIRVE